MRFGTEEGRRALTSRPRPEPQKQNTALVPSVYITVVLVRLSAPLSSCSPQPNTSDSWFQRGFSSSVGFQNHHACVHSRELTLQPSLLPPSLYYHALLCQQKVDSQKEPILRLQPFKIGIRFQSLEVHFAREQESIYLFISTVGRVEAKAMLYKHLLGPDGCEVTKVHIYEALSL